MAKGNPKSHPEAKPTSVSSPAPPANVGARDDPRHATRAALLELTRVTEQTAVLATMGLGRVRVRPMAATALESSPATHRGKYEPGYRQAILGAFFAALDASLVAPRRIINVEAPWLGYTENRTSGQLKKGSLAQQWNDRDKEKRTEAPLIDLLVSPLDGVSEVLQGQHGGSVSLVVGGPVGTFRLLDPPATGGPSTRWLTFATRDASIADQFRHAVERDLRCAPCTASEGRHLSGLFEELRRRGRADPSRVISTINTDAPFGIAPLLVGLRFREFVGSESAAALASMMPSGLPYFLGVTERLAPFTAAVAARIFGGVTLAVPLFPHKAEAGSPLRWVMNAERGSVLLGGDELVEGDGAFVVATGVTEHPVLRGVRFHADKRVETHTLVLNSRSGSSRTISHHRRIDRDHFYCLKTGGLASAEQVLADFEARL